MRALLFIACASVALAACGKNAQSDAALNGDENLTAGSIVSNDVTAIDAVTGDAANMAADTDMNFVALDENGTSASLNEGSAKPARTAPSKPTTAPEANSTANATANAQ